MSAARRGFTIIEVMVAVLVLSVGVIGLLKTSAGVSRMINRGRGSSRATQYAEQRLETLRRQAYATSPKCTALAGGTATQPGSLTEGWTVTTNGTTRTLSASVTYPRAGGTSSVTISTIIRCS